MLKKLLLVFFSINILFWSLASPFVKTAHAQTWFRQDFFDWYTKVYDTNATPADEIYGERYTAAQVEWVIYGIWAFIVNQFFVPDVAVCFFAAISDINDLGPCLANAISQALQDLIDLITYNPDTTGPALAKNHYNKPLIAMVFEDRPLSGMTYVKQKFKLVGEVNAQQGFGFTRLEVIQPLWRAARDVSYFFMVLATVIMAFMIMFRVKLSPQTVITIQSAIPKVIGGIILITFSYAIAGFFIDLVYVVIALLASLFDMAIPDPGIPGLVQSGMFYRLMTEGIPFIGLGAWGLMIIYMPIFFIAFMAAVIGTFGILNLVGLFMVAPLISMIVTILVSIMLLFITIKILWMLIKTVVSIYLLVVAGPFYILGGAVSPTMGFGSWAKNLASHLAVYPIAGAMFILSYLFLIYGAVSTLSNLPGIGNVVNLINNLFNALGFDAIIPGSAWEPPLTLNSPTGGNSIGVIFCFISLSVLFMIPKTVEIIKGLISGRPYAYGTAIGEAFGPLALAGGMGYSLGLNAQQAHYDKLSKAYGGPGLPGLSNRGMARFYNSVNQAANVLRSIKRK